MFISHNINQLMQQSLIGARVDDPVIPEPTKKHRGPKLRRRPARALAQSCASTISSSTTSPPRSVTS